MTHKRRKGTKMFIVAAIFLLLALLSWRVWVTRVFHALSNFNNTEQSSQLSCRGLPGANETLVVLKTGATEIPDKLPAHLETTTRCYPKYVIYSDFGENYQGQLVFDILESVNQTIRESHPDFELYRRLKESGRSALQGGTFEGGSSEVKTTGNIEHPGWKLDKWKFLPMLSRTLEDFPNMEWYVFAEVDTYIVWTSMLQFLSTLDSTESVYTGMYMWVGSVRFPYGGAGFVVSQPALQAAVAHYHGHKEELENFVDNHFNGDAAIGKAMRDAGVRFFNAWPVMQADYPGWLTFDVEAAKNWPMMDAIARFWCRPVVTFHHVSQDAVRALWLVEQKWISQQGKNSDGFLRHRDIFDMYTFPRMTTPPTLEWDNESDQEDPEASSMEECQRKCRGRSTCFQYSFEDSSSKCRLREDPRLGVAKSGTRSGWFVDRIRGFRGDMPICYGVHWPS